MALATASLAAVACAVLTDPSSSAGVGLQVAYQNDTVLVAGTVIPLHAIVTDGGVTVDGAQLRLTTSDSNIVAVRDLEVGTDTIIVKRRGHARIRATLVGATLGENPPYTEVNVTAIAASITIDSASVTFRNLLDTVTLKARVFDANGELIDSVARWRSLSPGVVTVDSISGTLQARGNTSGSPVTIRAIVDQDTAIVPVTVLQRLAHYQFSAPVLAISALNQDTVVTATPQDAGGNNIPLSTAGLVAPTFTSKNTAVVSVANVSSIGGAYAIRVSSITNDSTRIRVVSGSIDTSMAVVVGQVAQSIQIQGADTVFIDALQDTLPLRARAFDGKNVEVQTRQVIWTSLNTGVVTVNANGLTTAQARAGTSISTALITARLDGALDTVRVVVRDVPRTIRTAPVARQFTAIGDTSTITDTIFNGLGGRVAGASATWASLNTAAATVNTTTGLVTAVGIGTAEIVATISGCTGLTCSDTSLVTVSNEAVSVAITPTSLTLNSIGDAVQLPVTITNKLGATNLPPSSVSWSVDDPNVISVSSIGVVTALKRGILTGTPNVLAPAHVIARVPSGNNADTVAVIVTNAPVSLTLTPDSNLLTAPTRTLQYTAQARNASGAIIPAADLAAAGQPVSFRSTRTGAAIVDGTSGVATQVAVTTDSTRIIAEITGDVGLRADTARLLVTNTAVKVTLNRDTVAIGAVGDQAQLLARALNVSGDTVPGLTFVWTALNPLVAQVNAAGLVTATGLGVARVTAAFGALPPDTTIVVVTNAPTSINIPASAVTLASISDQVLPAATLLNRLGVALPRDAASWISVNPAIAAVSSTGLITALNRGVTQVIARSPLDQLVADTITVNVTNSAATINVLRTLDTLPSLNRTLLYTADVFNARGGQIIGEPVRWISRNPAVASIGAGSGIATALDTGTTIIAAVDTSLAGAVKDSATLVVRNLATAVEISPASLALPAVGNQTLVTANVRNEQGNPIVNVPVIWTTSAPSVVRFRPTAVTSSNGPITTRDTVRLEAVGSGSATISANVNGVINTMGVSVSNAPTTVTITSGNLTLASVGDAVTPAATISNAGGALPRNAVLWSSSNTNVASVNSNGDVTATGAGAATITATSPANAALNSSIAVTVTNAPVSVTLNLAGPQTLTALGRTSQLSAVVRNAANGIITNPAIIWGTASGAIATVNATGLVTAAGVGGPINITATAGTATASLAFTVTNNAVSLAVTPDSVTILDLTGAGSTSQMTAIALNDLGNAVPGSAITWTSVTTAVAGVNASGLVTAAATGTSIVRATANAGALHDSVLVTVVNAPRTLNIVPTTRSLASVGDTAFPQITLQNAAGAALPRTAAQWASSATNVATVSTDGIVTALSPGTTTITATSPFQPTVTDNYAVTVTNAPASVSLNQAAVTLTALGRTTTFSAVVRNAKGDPIPSASVTWSSGNAAVTIGAATGIATAAAVNAGVTITATVVGFPLVTGTANVVVTNAAASILASPTSIAFTAVGQTQGLTVQVLNDLGAVIAGAPVTVVSNDLAIATITGGTTVNAAGVGATTLTVTSGTVNTAVSVNVTDGNAPASIALDRPSLIIDAVGADSTVTATVRNGLGQVIAAAPVTWSQTGGRVTFSPNNTTNPVTASGATLGSGSITATATGGVFVTIPVTVRNDVGLVNITTTGTQGAPRYGNAGDSLLLAVTLQNSQGAAITSRQAVTWTSSNPAAAVVTDSGMVYFTGTGLTIIRAFSPTNTTARDSIFVTSGAVDHFTVEQTGGGAIPAQTAGTFNIRITARDVSNNVVPTFTGTVDLTSTGALTGAPLTSATFTSGVLASQAVTITTAGTALTITATQSGGTKTGTSNGFDVTAGALHHFLVTNTSGGAITTQTVGNNFNIRVTAQDQFDNTVLSFNGTGNRVDVEGANGGTLNNEPVSSGNFVNGVESSITIQFTGAGSAGSGRAVKVTRQTGGTETGTSNTFTVNP